MYQDYNTHVSMPMPGIPTQQTYTQTGHNVNGFQNRQSHSDIVVSSLKSLLDNAGVNELQELHDHEDKLYKLLDDNNEVKQIQVEREMQLAENRRLADDNMKQGPTLSAGKQNLSHLYKQYNEQNQQFEINKGKLESLASQYNPDTIMALLQTSVAQTEESSEKTADSFMDGDIAVDDFLEKYLKERTSLHIRRTKVDKLKELLRRR